MRARTSPLPRPAFDLSRFEETKTRDRWKTLPATIASVLFHAGLLGAALMIVRAGPSVRRGGDPIVVTLGSGSGTAPEASQQLPKLEPPSVTSTHAASKPAPHIREMRRETKPATPPEIALPSPPAEPSTAVSSAPSQNAKPNASSSSQGSNDRSASAGAAAGTGGGAGGGNAAVGIDAVEHPPAIVSSVTPVYPQLARRRGIEGVVVLKFVVNQIGEVEKEIQIVESVPILDDAAIDALRRWRFSPGRDRDGNPVRVLLEIPIRFTLR